MRNRAASPRRIEDLYLWELGRRFRLGRDRGGMFAFTAPRNVMHWWHTGQSFFEWCWHCRDWGGENIGARGVGV